MALVRNVSGQSIVITRTGGGVLQLLPARAAHLSDAEQRSGQIQNLLQSGRLRLEEMAEAAPKGAGKESKRTEARDKKKG